MSLHDVRFEVRFNSYLPVGTAVLMARHGGPPLMFYRHPSEWAVHLSGATWHPIGERCPTWTDECRCMLGGDA